MYLDFGHPLGLSTFLATVVPLFWRERHSITYRPALPPSYPLAVRNPYLSAWMPGDQVKTLPYAEPQFWAGQSLTWSVMARVDGQTYSLMSEKNPDDEILAAVVSSAEYTSTHSVFTLSAGSVTFTLDFFSPVSPSNHLRQSLPFSYLTVSVSDTSANSIQVYSSIDDRWVGKQKNTGRSFQGKDTTAVFSLGVRNSILYEEQDDMATWGEAIFASRPIASSKLSFASGKHEDIRSQFVSRGRLNGNDPWRPGRIVALSHDLGAVVSDLSVRFVVGTLEAVTHSLDDYQDALRESLILDLDLATKAKLVAGQKYADIVTLSTRQAYGAIDLTIPNDSLDVDDTLAFIKELSSNGNINTIDVIMPAFPIYYVMSPEYIRLLLEPMMRYLAAGRWREPYTIHDMGAHYPNATGHDNQQAEPMPIEECGNLMVLALGYIRATGDRDWVIKYQDLIRHYADYLVNNGVDIAEQLSSNDAAGPLANETNLAIKAAVGLKAFGELTELAEYSRIGEERADLFSTQGLGTDGQKTHFVLQYPGKPASWKIPYNLYPDVLFGLKTFPQGTHQMSSTFFKSVRGEYGVPLDNRQDWAKSDWNMWLAATFESDTRDEFVEDLWAFMTNGKHNWPFSDRYVATSGKGASPGVPVLCRARPTVGGHFALMAFDGPRSLQNAVASSMALPGDGGEEFFEAGREEL